LDFNGITQNERNWSKQIKVNLKLKRENVVLQKMKTQGQNDKYSERVKAGELKQKAFYEAKKDK
jgi:hypothetical protein